MQALEHPFGLEAPVCVPDLHAVSSKKTRVLTRGTFETSSVTGVGYIIINPWRADNLSAMGYKTDSAYPGGSGTNYATAGVGISAVIGSKFPYSSTVWGAAGISHRIVGVGLRVRYTGIELYRGGRAVMLRRPENKTLVAIESVTSTFNYSQAKTFPVTNDWVMVCYKPVRPAEYDYSANPGSADLIATYDYSMVFAVTGTAGPVNLSASFEYEVVTHVEYIGEIDGITKSHVDLLGMSEIRNATMSDKPTRSGAESLWRSITNVGSNLLEKSSPMIKESIQQSVTQSLMSGLWDSGKSALSYLSKIPGRLESGAMSALKDTFSGGILDTLAELAEGGALMLL